MLSFDSTRYISFAAICMYISLMNYNIVSAKPEHNTKNDTFQIQKYNDPYPSNNTQIDKAKAFKTQHKLDSNQPKFEKFNHKKFKLNNEESRQSSIEVSPSPIRSLYNNRLYPKNKRHTHQAEQDHLYQTRAVALGVEHELGPKPQMSSPSDLLAPTMTNPNNILSSSSPSPEANQIYGQQQQMILNPEGQEQVLAQFYVNEEPTNQVVPLHHGSFIDVNNNFRNNPVYAGATDGAYLRMSHNQLRQDTQQYQQHQPGMSQDVEQFKRPHDESKQTHRFHNINSIKDQLSEDNKVLSNAQLASLIDELKEYNARQASKIQAKISPEHNFAKDSDVEQETQKESAQNKDGQQSVRGKEDFDDSINDDETSKGELPQSGDMNTEDLARFAKFLMTKEGSNLKFQLGLDKDSPDDGDEIDDRDPLLESKKTTLKTRPAKKLSTLKLEDLDRKHSEVDAHMDKLITDMKEKMKPNGQRSNEKKRKESFDELIDRKKREQKDDSSITEINNTPTVPKKTKIKKTDEQNMNFAKMLIQKELMEDRHDSDKPESKINNAPQKNRRSSGMVVMEPSSSINEFVNGKRSLNGDRYPKLERNRDHIAFIHELQKTRGKKHKTRSRLPIAENPILKRALDGGLGVQTEIQPDGTLSLRSNKNNILKLKLPKQKQANADKNHNDDYESKHTERLTPKLSKESQLVNRVQFESPNTIQDEYPVSERVSDRLNKLSNNLDRYFNDGFLQEIESKSRMESPKGSKDHHQSSPSNINESAETDQEKKNLKGKIDQDFDVDVGIDGKRDNDSNPDEDDHDKEDSSEDGEEKELTERKPLKKVGLKLNKKKRIKNKALKEGENRKPNSTTRITRKELKRPAGNERKAGSLLRDESMRKERVEYENTGNILPVLDPVENESLDTAIGPDNDEGEVDPRNTSKMKTSEQSNVSTRYGKKVGGKFYEEPKWK